MSAPRAARPKPDQQARKRLDAAVPIGVVLVGRYGRYCQTSSRTNPEANTSDSGFQAVRHHRRGMPGQTGDDLDNRKRAAHHHSG